MNSSTNSDIQSDNKSYLRILLSTLFLVFTIILFTMTWKIQNSCEPLVGQSLCVSEHSSLIRNSWNFTKHKSNQLLQRSWELMPKRLFFWK